MSWALRTAFFAEGRNLALRHELLLVAAQVAKISPLDLDRFTLDWDTGRYKETVLTESQRGWHTLKLDGSATLVLPDGRAFTNPATHSPEGSDPLEELRSILASVG